MLLNQRNLKILIYADFSGWQESCDHLPKPPQCVCTNTNACEKWTCLVSRFLHDTTPPHPEDPLCMPDSSFLGTAGLVDRSWAVHPSVWANNNTAGEVGNVHRKPVLLWSSSGGGSEPGWAGLSSLGPGWSKVTFQPGPGEGRGWAPSRNKHTLSHRTWPRTTVCTCMCIHSCLA